jgi:hypothetical protein
MTCYLGCVRDGWSKWNIAMVGANNPGDHDARIALGTSARQVRSSSLRTWLLASEKEMICH